MKKVTPKAKVSTTVRGGGKSNAAALLSSAQRIAEVDASIPGGIEAAFKLRHNSRSFAMTELVFADHLVQAKTNYRFLQGLCYDLSRYAGWHDHQMDDNTFGTKIALIHSEISEALEGYRKSKPDDHLPHRTSVEVELADAVIRIMDLSGAMGLDVAGAIIEKLHYNQTREDHKTEARMAQGGKRF